MFVIDADKKDKRTGSVFVSDLLPSIIESIKHSIGTPISTMKSRGNGGYHLYYHRPQTDDILTSISWRYGDTRCDAQYIVIWEPRKLLDLLMFKKNGPERFEPDLEALKRDFPIIDAIELDDEKGPSQEGGSGWQDSWLIEGNRDNSIALYAGI